MYKAAKVVYSGLPQNLGAKNFSSQREKHVKISYCKPKLLDSLTTSHLKAVKAVVLLLDFYVVYKFDIIFNS